MAASKMYDSIVNFVAQSNDEFLQRVADDYKLDLDELRTKYTDVVKVAGESKKRKATVTVTDEQGQEVKKAKGERPACKGITAKKEPCKFAALKGGCFCLRHQKAHDDAKEGSETPKPKPVKVVKPTPVQPMHSHAPDTEVHADCELCQSHGAVFGGAFEVEEAPLEERLRALIDTADGEDSDAETIDPSAAAAPAAEPAARFPFQEEEFSDAEFPADEPRSDA